MINDLLDDEDDLVELPGGLDQLEAIVENMNQPIDNSNCVFKEHGKSGKKNSRFFLAFIILSSCVTNIKYHNQ